MVLLVVPIFRPACSVVFCGITVVDLSVESMMLANVVFVVTVVLRILDGVEVILVEVV